MARPGKTAIHHALLSSWRPWATIRPQLTSGGWMPIPRKLSDDSVSITKQKSRAATVSRVGRTVGATWRRMDAQLPVPKVRAASMNSRLRSSADSARAVRR
jgi:hypothetical protein